MTDPARQAVAGRGLGGRAMPAARIVLSIARLTLLETTRSRVVLVLAVLTLVSVGLTTWGIDRLVTFARAENLPQIQIQIGVSQVLILAAFMFSFVLAMTGAFLASPAIDGEIDSGVALALLARPLGRAELLLGKWLALVIIVTAYAVASGLLEIAAVRAVSGYQPPDPGGAVAFPSGQAITLLTVALALSTRLPAIAGGAVSVVVFSLAWMSGVFGGVGVLFDVGPLMRLDEVSRWVLPTDGLWRGVLYSLEPPLVSLLAGGRASAALQANPFYASSPPSAVYLAWCLAWIVVVLGLAIWSLSRRDL